LRPEAVAERRGAPSERRLHRRLSPLALSLRATSRCGSGSGGAAKAPVLLAAPREKIRRLKKEDANVYPLY